MSICKNLLKESCPNNCKIENLKLSQCVCYEIPQKGGSWDRKSMDRTMATYAANRVHKNFNNLEYRKKAEDIMVDFAKKFEGKITLWPMFGTLLGIVRENGIIPHDDDIDFGFFKSEEETLIGILDQLHENKDYTVIRNQHGTIYTVFKDDVFIDLYLYERTNTEQINQGHRHFYNILKKEMFPFKKIKFNNFNFNCIANPISFFERIYGKDWQTPK